MLTLAMQMPLGEALAVSLIGIITVLLILTVIDLLIILVSKFIRTIEKKSVKAEAANVKEASPVPAEGVTAGQVELIGTDEKEAAVIMAIVSQKSGIPLNRLSFKSIKCINEKEENK